MQIVSCGWLPAKLFKCTWNLLFWPSFWGNLILIQPQSSILLPNCVTLSQKNSGLHGNIWLDLWILSSFIKFQCFIVFLKLSFIGKFVKQPNTHPCQSRTFFILHHSLPWQPKNNIIRWNNLVKIYHPSIFIFVRKSFFILNRLTHCIGYHPHSQITLLPRKTKYPNRFVFVSVAYQVIWYPCRPRAASSSNYISWLDWHFSVH